MNAYLKKLTENEYEKYLNEIYSEIKIGYLTFSPGKIVRKLDPVAFRCGISAMDEKWICSYCEMEYDNETEAENCCRNWLNKL